MLKTLYRIGVHGKNRKLAAFCLMFKNHLFLLYVEAKLLAENYLELLLCDKFDSFWTRFRWKGNA